tara:strand:- start:4265 stop:5161 length:897 start_codon:yes stop_codon:yes gene_type:complete
MNTHTKTTIKTLFFLSTLSWLLPLSLYIEASENVIAQTQTSSKKDAVTQHLLVQAFPESEQDTEILKVLEETKTFQRIKKIVSSNFILNTPIQLHILHAKDIQQPQPNIEPKFNVIPLSFNFLHTLHQGLSNKYEHQPEVINIIFSASIEFYVWSEFADYLIKEKQLEIIGDSYATKDNFAAIMLLNQNNPNSDYIADASEAYLLIRHTNTSHLSQHSQNELQLDQLRYKHIICLTLGFDQIIQNPEIERLHLNSFSWDEDKIDQCKNSYSLVMKNWHKAISPALQEESVIHHWVNLL